MSRGRGADSICPLGLDQPRTNPMPETAGLTSETFVPVGRPGKGIGWGRAWPTVASQQRGTSGVPAGAGGGGGGGLPRHHRHIAYRLVSSKFGSVVCRAQVPRTVSTAEAPAWAPAAGSPSARKQVASQAWLKARCRVRPPDPSARAWLRRIIACARCLASVRPSTLWTRPAAVFSARFEGQQCDIAALEGKQCHIASLPDGPPTLVRFPFR